MGFLVFLATKITGVEQRWKKVTIVPSEEIFWRIRNVLFMFYNASHG